MNMILLSIRRRKKEIRYVSIVTFAAVFFMTGILLFQDILNQFVMERNYQLYGNWVLASPGERLSHPYLIREGYTDTSAQAVDDKLHDTSLYFGTFDSNLSDFGNISLYEGRLPEKNNEVAMDLYSLSSLGYSYDLGQEITLSWLDREGEMKGEAPLHTNTYVLVGTLKSYINTWKTTPMTKPPGILLTEEELALNYLTPTRTWYYQLDPSLSDLDVYAFYEAFLANHENTVYNSYVYDGQIWLNSDIFLSVTYVIIVIAGAAVGYLLASYTAKRRSLYYRYRCMGANKGQIRKMICIECLYATVPMAVLGILAAYLIGFAGCRIASSAYGLPYFYRFDAAMFARQIAAIVAVLLIAILWTILRTGDSRLAAGSFSVSEKGLKTLHRIAPKSKYPERQFETRYRKLHPLSYTASILFSVLSCGFLILCSNRIAAIALPTWNSRQNFEDFHIIATVDAKDTYQTEDGNLAYITVETYDLTYGLDGNDMLQLQQIQGIDFLLTATYDGVRYLDWKEKEDSELLQYLRDIQSARSELNYNMVFNFYDSNETAKEYLSQIQVETETDWDSWDNGESIIIILPTGFYYPSFDSEIAWIEIYDNTIHPGETVMIKTVSTEDQIPVTAADVIHFESIFPTTLPYVSKYSSMTKAGNITILASMQLADRLAESTNTAGNETVKINYLKGRLNPFASFEATDKQIARFAVECKFRYDSSFAEARRIQLQTILQTLIIYGSLFCVMLVILIVLQKNFVDSRNRYCSAQYRLLKQIGMDDTAYLAMSLRAAVLEYLWLLAGIPVGYLIDATIEYIGFAHELAGGTSSYSTFFHRALSYNPIWPTLNYLVFSMPHLWTVLIVLVLFLILTANRYVRAKKYMKTEVN